MRVMKLFFVWSAILVQAWNAEARIAAVIGPTDLKSNTNLANFIPEVNDNEIIISRDQYVISYNRSRRSPNWVEWKLETENIGNTARTNEFSADADLQSYFSSQGLSDTPVDPYEYSGSCFDRGHQIPSKDRSDSPENNKMTFVMSNIIPQTAYLNRVIWEHLEQYARDLVQKQGKKVYIIAGPVYDEDFGYIGPRQDIPIPSKDFKILIVLNQDQTPADINSSTPVVAVMMPNVFQDGTKPAGGRCVTETPDRSYDAHDWEKYQTTVAEIQRVTGLQFMSLNH